MRELLIGVVLLVLVGIAGFFYRNAMERPGPITACTKEAKVCPDGSVVGRTGPACEFAACPTSSNAGDIGLTYTVPEGYVADENAYGAEPTLVAAFVKASASGNPPHTIIVRRYPIPEGQTANSVILANTRFQPADMQAESFERFEDVTIGNHTFRSVVIERFEAIVQSAYYLPRADDVVRFEIIEHDVVDWMEPTLAIKKLPEHAAFLRMLATIAP